LVWHPPMVPPLLEVFERVADKLADSGKHPLARAIGHRLVRAMGFGAAARRCHPEPGRLPGTLHLVRVLRRVVLPRRPGFARVSGMAVRVSTVLSLPKFVRAV